MPKHEGIASRHMALIPGVEVFCPHIRYRKITSRGAVWFTEAIFPGYVLAKFNLYSDLRRICATPGVRGVVRFGNEYGTLAQHVVDDLRKNMNGSDIKVFAHPVEVGDLAKVAEGPFCGLEGVVSRFMPAINRVRILIDMLGRKTEVEVGLDALAAKPLNPLAA